QRSQSLGLSAPTLSQSFQRSQCSQPLTLSQSLRLFRYAILCGTGTVGSTLSSSIKKCVIPILFASRNTAGMSSSPCPNGTSFSGPVNPVRFFGAPFRRSFKCISFHRDPYFFISPTGSPPPNDIQNISISKDTYFGSV